MSRRKILIREIAPYKLLYRDPETGIAWVADGSTGMGMSAHPNIDASGSVAGMKSIGYWDKTDMTVRSHGFIYNVSRLVGLDEELTRIAAEACECAGCRLRKGIDR